MVKNNKGVTLVSLGITILIMIVIAGATIATSNIIEKAEEQEIITNMMLIQTKVRIIMERAEFSGDTNKYYIGNRQSSGLYEYNQAILDSIGLEGIKLNEERYLVDYETGDIIYQKGDTEYKLSEMM